jgi:hypothetical protein
MSLEHIHNEGGVAGNVTYTVLVHEYPTLLEQWETQVITSY